jgi:glycosyltransferase involved in cell wall biosynthesis
MRVLVVHNRYSSRSPSGENAAVDDEVRWLGEAGVEVVSHQVSNDEMVDVGALDRVRDGLGAVWSVPARRRFERVLDDSRPDLVHVHNLFPLLSASVPLAARRRGLPVVWTVHNRRVRCVAGGYFRGGRPCHDCRPGWRVPGVVHGCYADSRGASALVTAATSLFRRAARRGVVPVAISRTIADWLGSAGGFDRAGVRVKYNGVDAPAEPPPPPGEQRRFCFVGRLSAYKGIVPMLAAWTAADVDAELHILGDGDLAAEVRAAAAADPRIVWPGQVSPVEVADTLRTSRAMLVPSLWEEGFGRVAAEALAFGRPVITTGHGGLAEVVDETTGWITGSSQDALVAAIREAATSASAVEGRGAAAARRHAERFSPQVTTAELIAIYEGVRRPSATPTSAGA